MQSWPWSWRRWGRRVLRILGPSMLAGTTDQISSMGEVKRALPAALDARDHQFGRSQYSYPSTWVMRWTPPSFAPASHCATLVLRLSHSRRRRPLMKATTVGIDLAKTTFQVCALNRAGKVISNRPVKRAALAETVAQLRPTHIAMESCSGAHHWCRTFKEFGHEVILVPPQHVKPFVRGGKSDPRDALAICEAAHRPGLHPVPIKSLAQQDLQSLHRVRQQQVQHSTGIANQIRGIAHEYGVCFPVGLKRLYREVPYALEDADNGLTDAVRELLARRFIDLLAIREEIERTSRRIVTLAQGLPPWSRLLELPGFGVMVTSSYLAAIGDGRQFKRGRQVSAWLGLVPRQHGSGGKIRLHGMTKSGDRYLRTMMLHGARAAIC